jgi:hypothetical protein
VDDLGDDQAVAACFAEHLPKLTPMTVVVSTARRFTRRRSSDVPVL